MSEKEDMRTMLSKRDLEKNNIPPVDDDRPKIALKRGIEIQPPGTLYTALLSPKVGLFQPCLPSFITFPKTKISNDDQTGSCINRSAIKVH